MEGEEYFGKAHIENLVLQKAKTLLVLCSYTLGLVLYQCCSQSSSGCLPFAYTTEIGWNQHHPTRRGAFMLGIASCLSGFHFKGFVNDARGYCSGGEGCLPYIYQIYTLPFHKHSWTEYVIFEVKISGRSNLHEWDTY